MNKKGVDALVEGLRFLDDLNVQLLDHAHSDEEVEKSTDRWGLLVPVQLARIPAGLSGDAMKRRMEERTNQARLLRKDQSDRVNIARRVLQELIREFGKSDDVLLKQIEPG